MDKLNTFRTTAWVHGSYRLISPDCVGHWNVYWSATHASLPYAEWEQVEFVCLSKQGAGNSYA